MNGPSDPSLDTSLDRPTKHQVRAIAQFDDNSLVPLLYGEHNKNLAQIEARLGLSLSSKGNQIILSGSPEAVDAAGRVIDALYSRLEKGLAVDAGEIDATIRMTETTPGDDPDSNGGDDVHSLDKAIITQKRKVFARSKGQKVYMAALQDHEMVFGIGPAGTGKTYLAVAKAVAMMKEGLVERIILSRPAVEAGERLGFLPGDLQDKIDPYLRPLYDALYDMLPGDQVAKRLAAGDIEVAPLAFMRGRTLANAFVILDEAQNTTPVQMKMFLTRMGENSRMVVTGDLSQIDLPTGHPSGLRVAVETLGHMDEISFVQFTDADVVRHHLVTKIVRAYAARESDDATGDLFAARRRNAAQQARGQLQGQAQSGPPDKGKA